MPPVLWRTQAAQYIILFIGAVINAASVVVFLTPFNIAPSGISGLAVILNTLIGTPIGLMTIMMNIPIQYLAYRMLPGGLSVIFRTVFVVIVYSVSLDVLGRFVPPGGINRDLMLNAIFGGASVQGWWCGWGARLAEPARWRSSFSGAPARP
jgi:uncharacterized membrane-anchored protein YitT (DUF2179 family)